MVRAPSRSFAAVRRLAVVLRRAPRPQHRSRAGAWLLLAALWLAAACARLEVDVPAPAPPRPATTATATAPLRAGAARVDVTPPPGFTTAGHAIEGQLAVGHLTPLRVRAIYVEDARGEPLVLVASDAWAVSRGLRDRVAELLAARASTRHIGVDRLILGPSHTHQSAGNHASTLLYNMAAQPSLGFDPALFEFIAARTATAITLAVARARPVRVVRADGRLDDVQRNRSLTPFRANPGADAFIAARAARTCTLSRLTSDPDACRAVRDDVVTLRFEALDRPGEWVAVAAFLALHPTAMPNLTPLFSGDVFGVAAATAEAELAGPLAKGTPVVALFNGAEGDVSPTWAEQGHADMLRVAGHAAAGIVARAGEPGRELRGAVWGRTRTLSLARAQVHGHAALHVEPGVREGARTHAAQTAAQPRAGMSTFGGAEDGITHFAKHRRYREGEVVRDPPGRDGHGHKQPGLMGRLVTR